MSNTINLMQAMGLNRKSRRMIAKANGGVKIKGSQKPYTKPKNEKS